MNSVIASAGSLRTTRWVLAMNSPSPLGGALPILRPYTLRPLAETEVIRKSGWSRNSTAVLPAADSAGRSVLVTSSTVRPTSLCAAGSIVTSIW